MTHEMTHGIDYQGGIIMATIKYVGEQLEWLERIAEGRDQDQTLGSLLAELRAADRDYWAHEASVSGDVALHLAGKLADGDSMRAVEIERAAREELYPTA